MRAALERNDHRSADHPHFPLRNRVYAVAAVNLQTALTQANDVLACRWHCFVYECERDGGLDRSLSLYEHAEVEKAFLWMRATLIRAAPDRSVRAGATDDVRFGARLKKKVVTHCVFILCLGVFGHFVGTAIRPDFDAEHRGWIRHALRTSAGLFADA